MTIILSQYFQAKRRITQTHINIAVCVIYDRNEIWTNVQV